MTPQFVATPPLLGIPVAFPAAAPLPAKSNQGE
jgi:hypothetical protein